ncbi:MAG: hypothetical protein K2Q06_13010, partial [Parvularculaceae bacterium]|nr:hypothetical protein [Parvularculaceae bacterium]
NGAGVWEKPLKFCVSLALHFFTLAALAQLLSRERRTRPVLHAVSLLSAAAAAFEIAYVAIQAARGRRSHFNFETPFEIQMYAAMGVGAVILVLVAFVLGVAIASEKSAPPSGLRSGAVLGLAVGAVLTLVVAGTMSASGSHYAGAPNLGGPSDAGGLPLFGWSTTEPDLRPAHFVALHMMQALPVIGWIFDRIAPRAARGVVLAACVVLSLFSLGLFALALAGVAPLGVLG